LDYEGLSISPSNKKRPADIKNIPIYWREEGLSPNTNIATAPVAKLLQPSQAELLQARPFFSIDLMNNETTPAYAPYPSKRRVVELSSTYLASWKSPKASMLTMGIMYSILQEWFISSM